jgi:hypothetical protein
MGQARRSGDAPMSGATARGLSPLERLTSTTAFAVLLGLSAAVGLLLLLAGGMLASALLTAGDARSVPVSGLVAGGCAGLAGLLVGRASPDPPRAGRIELTIVLLGGAVAAALVVIACAVGLVYTRIPGAGIAVMPAFVAGAHGVLIVAAAGTAARLTRRYAEHAGEPFDALPTVLLLAALSLALLALAGTLVLLSRC